MNKAKGRTHRASRAAPLLLLYFVFCLLPTGLRNQREPVCAVRAVVGRQVRAALPAGGLVEVARLLEGGARLQLQPAEAARPRLIHGLRQQQPAQALAAVGAVD